MGVGIKDLLNDAMKYAAQNSHNLTGIGAMVGVGVTVFFTFTATPKICALNDQRKEELKSVDGANTWDINKKYAIEIAKASSGVTISATATLALIFGTLVLANKKINDLSAIAQYTGLLYTQTLNKLEEKEGAEKKEEIKKEAVAQVLEEDTETPDLIFQARGGHVLFFDVLGGRYFWSDIQTIREVVTDCNNNLDAYEDLPVNDFYNDMWLPDVGAADRLCWRKKDSCFKIRVNLENAMSTGWGGSARVLDWYTEPVPVSSKAFEYA